MRFNIPALIAGLAITSFSATAVAETRLQVNVNSNQFPTITVHVRAFDTTTGKAAAGITKEDILLSEDLSEIGIDDFETLSKRIASNPNVDVMFVFDQTGSMADEIAALLARTQKFADAIAHSGINYRLGLLTFSDSIEKQFPYTADVNDFKKNVAALRANGGDDEPENQLDALMAAAKMDSRPEAKHIFILVTDAPYHFQDRVTSRRPEDVIAALRADAIQLHVVGPELDSYKNMSRELVGNFYDKDSDDFTSIVASIASEISANYQFTYRSSRMLPDGTRRAVRVALKGKSATDAAQYVAPWFVTASSRQDAGRGDESAYAPYKVMDGNPGTAWFPSELGMANHEWIHLSLPAARTIKTVTVNAASGYKFNDLNTVTLSLDGGPDLTGALDGMGANLKFTLKDPVPVHQMHFGLRATAGVRLGIADINAFLPDGSMIPEIAMHHVSSDKRDSAKELNAKGERAYHAGKLDESVKLYQAAIHADPEYAQAYSNLGLSYWKLKDYPKSVEANRSAIALGKRQGDQNVMASSYYNIARTFEEQKEYKQSLMNFWWANKVNPKPVYQKNINRMNALIASEAE